MKHIVAFSGGKDSQAVLIWAKASIKDQVIAVFCDTGHEAHETYLHITYCCKALDIELITLKGKYDFFNLSKKKKRFPSVKARFCTDHLKFTPMVDFILSLKEDTIVYQGIRWNESLARRSMKRSDEYFRAYIDKKKFAWYRRLDVMEYLEKYSVDVIRPVISWSAENVMLYIRESGLIPNPLYQAGMKRVGCFPCVMCGHGEIKQMAINFPERIQYVREMEMEMGRTFFPPDYIPRRFCSTKSGAPTIDDVVKYVYQSDQLEMFDTPSCLSHYNICE